MREPLELDSGDGSGTPSAATIETDPLPPLDSRTFSELCSCFVPYGMSSHKGGQIMVRAVVSEALALASLSLFLATLAVWAQVFGVL